MKLAERVRSGDRLALARLLTLVDNNSQEGQEALSELHASTGRAHRVGVTGAPGTGKSVLVNRLTLHLRAQDDPPKVAIVAVDPTSPFTGGAILGDRIRMRELSGDEGIFIRSMANRGALGGLARNTSGIVDALDAAGFQTILIETVGTGQAEVDVASAAHTVVVLEAPGMGDAVQALKAGLLEIADILVVNKSDLPGAENTARSSKSHARAWNCTDGVDHPRAAGECRKWRRSPGASCEDRGAHGAFAEDRGANCERQGKG